MDEERGGRRGGGGGGYDRGPRTMYDAVCSDCGQATQVPFKPFSFELHPVMRLARSSFFLIYSGAKAFGDPRDSIRTSEQLPAAHPRNRSRHVLSERFISNAALGRTWTASRCRRASRRRATSPFSCAGSGP